MTRHCGTRGSCEVAPFDPKKARVQRPGKSAQDRMEAAIRPRALAALNRRRAMKDDTTIEQEEAA